MTFQEWLNSTPHRAKYSGDHPAYLAAKEAWEAAHEACAKVCDAVHARHIAEHGDYLGETYAVDCAASIRARGQE